MIFLYLTITSIQRLIQSGEELDQANREVEQAEKELVQAEKELDNLIQYGCTNPVIRTGIVMCP